jgi:glucose/mannose-6-phosphate isomerase|tara:strand:+ start:58 stop:1065 length:1008 start_codon:yes stop_codon:yes gene_type:complete
LKIDDIKSIDSDNMSEVYDGWPQIARKNFSVNFSKVDIKNIDHVVFAGMGGSGTIGDVFASILSKTDIHVSVVKGYLLPKTVDDSTLVVTTSISGNTLETISILKNVEKMNAKFVALSSGGTMEKFCMDKKIKYYKIEEEHSPRASFVGFLYSALNILEQILPVKKIDVNESIESLFDIQKSICSKNLNETNEALQIAEWIKEIPMVYYPSGLQSAAIRFKNSMQENAKVHVITEDVIEACHNGIVAWDKPKNVQPILIQGKDDYVKTKERWEIIKELFRENGIQYKEIFSQEGSILNKLVCLIYLLDYASIYNAIISKTDPTPIKSIDFIKKRL